MPENAPRSMLRKSAAIYIDIGLHGGVGGGGRSGGAPCLSSQSIGVPAGGAWTSSVALGSQQILHETACKARNPRHYGCRLSDRGVEQPGSSSGS